MSGVLLIALVMFTGCQDPVKPVVEQQYLNLLGTRWEKGEFESFYSIQTNRDITIPQFTLAASGTLSASGYLDPNWPYFTRKQGDGSRSFEFREFGSLVVFNVPDSGGGFGYAADIMGEGLWESWFEIEKFRWFPDQFAIQLDSIPYWHFYDLHEEGPRGYISGKLTSQTAFVLANRSMIIDRGELLAPEYDLWRRILSFDKMEYLTYTVESRYDSYEVHKDSLEWLVTDDSLVISGLNRYEYQLQPDTLVLFHSTPIRSSEIRQWESDRSLEAGAVDQLTLIREEHWIRAD